MNQQKDIGKSISVHSSSYDDLASGRLKAIYRPYDDWNRTKFCSQQIKWLYVCKTDDVMGECLKISVKSVLRTTRQTGTVQIPVILIQLGEIAETRNRRTGERTFFFPSGNTIRDRQRTTW